MSVYLDASTFTTLPLNDEGWDVLERWLGALGESPAYSDLTWGEFVSAVAARVRGGALARDRADELLLETATICAPWRRVSLRSDDLITGTDLVARFELGLRLPDALHIAIARRVGCTLVTTDRQQARAAAALGYAVLNPLAGEPNP